MWSGLLLPTGIFVFVILWNSFRWKSLRKLPPFLPGLPIIGNLYQAYPTLSHLMLDRWKQQMGPIYSLNMAGQTMVVITDAKIACAILDKMSALSSSRAPFVMGTQLMAKNLFISTTPYGEQWRRHRRASHEVVHSQAARVFRSIQQAEAGRLVKDLLSEEGAYVEHHLKRVAASTIWRALYGGPPLNSVGDTTLDTIDDLLATILKVYKPGGSLVDMMPALLYLPTCISPFKRYAEAFHKHADAFFRGIASEAFTRATVSGNANIATALHERQSHLNLSDKEVAWVSGVLFAGGAETTSLTLMYFILAMVLYPEVARKAQRELDSVVGNAPPTFEDQETLPYIGAIIREAMRWRSVLPLGIPHFTIDEITYGEYVIPKNTMIIAPHWSICRDPAIFPDYDVFRPERFLDRNDPSKLKLTTDEGGRYSDFPFGFGRRICVGKDLAVNTLYINIAMLLWAFNFEKARDAQGREIEPSSTDYHDTGLTVGPLPFPCELVPRSERVMELFTTPN